jgi:hypothetical protein
MLEIDKETFEALVKAREDRAVEVARAAEGNLTPTREKRIRQLVRMTERSLWSRDKLVKWPDGGKMLDVRKHPEMIEFESYGGVGITEARKERRARENMTRSESSSRGQQLRYYTENKEEEPINIVFNGDTPDVTVLTSLREWRREMELYQRKRDGTKYRSVSLTEDFV